MKLGFAIALAGAVAFSALGQLGPTPHDPGRSFSSALNGGTNNVLAASTNSYSISFNCSSFADPLQDSDFDVDFVGLAFMFTGSTNATGNCIVRIADSIDGKHYETYPSHTYTIPVVGTNHIVYIDAIPVPTAARIKIVSVEYTGGTGYLTNLTAIWSIKHPAWNWQP